MTDPLELARRIVAQGLGQGPIARQYAFDVSKALVDAHAEMWRLEHHIERLTAERDGYQRETFASQAAVRELVEALDNSHAVLLWLAARFGDEERDLDEGRRLGVVASEAWRKMRDKYGSRFWAL